MTLPSLCPQNSIALASVQLPPGLFSPAAAAAPSRPTPLKCKLQLLVFRNGKLFCSTGNSSHLADDGKRRGVATPVIYAGTRKGLFLPGGGTAERLSPAPGGQRSTENVLEAYLTPTQCSPGIRWYPQTGLAADTRGKLACSPNQYGFLSPPEASTGLRRPLPVYSSHQKWPGLQASWNGFPADEEGWTVP